MLTFDDVQAAAARVASQIERTPVLTNRTLDVARRADVFLKAECLQTTGSFKFRGASNAIQALSAEEREAGVITYSSGNHAQAVARAARLAGSSAVVVMPNDAPLQKVAATQAEGARLVRYDRYNEDRAELAAGLAAAESRVLIPPYDHPKVMAGQGTVALELLEQVGRVDAVFIPVGGGGLLAGCATAIEHLAPGTEIYGVEPATGDDHLRSRRAGERVDIGVPVTIADGQQVSCPGELTWPITNRLTTRFLTVTDGEIVSTMRLLLRHLKILVEPSGASALAAVLKGDVDVIGKRVGVVLSGGNIGWPRFRELTAA